MNKTDFCHRIKISPALTEENKEYYLKKSETYAPEVRTNLINALIQGEEMMAQKGREAKDQHQQTKHSHIHQRMLQEEQEHQKEIKQSEALLEDFPKNPPQ